MKYEKRKLIHEYSEHFGCESVAYDAEPNRNVVATALKEKVIFYIIKYLFISNFINSCCSFKKLTKFIIFTLNNKLH